MAAHYVERIREVRPHGPYHLLGWSFGGLVAHEMAVRLQELGEEVGLLSLLDSYPVERVRDSERYTPTEWNDIDGLLADLWAAHAPSGALAEDDAEAAGSGP